MLRVHQILLLQPADTKLKDINFYLDKGPLMKFCSSVVVDTFLLTLFVG